MQNYNKSKKGAEKLFELVIVVLALLILLWVAMAIALPRINKISEIDYCPGNIGRCVNQYDPSACGSRYILTEYKCESSAEVCCKYTKEEEEALNDDRPIGCERDGSKVSEECLCNNQESLQADTKVSDGTYDAFGKKGMDCDGSILKYCIDTESDLYDNFLNKFSDLSSDFYCFEFNPLHGCEYRDGVTPNEFPCNCNLDSSIDSNDCDGVNLKYCKGSVCHADEVR